MQAITVNPIETFSEAMDQLPRGAFLTLKRGDEINTMTIGWGLAGFIWRKPVLTVVVRTSRHSFGMLEETGEFTVSFPEAKTFQKELAFCGKNSGRDTDKISTCGFNLQAGREIATPVLEIPGLHYECRLQLRSRMDSALMEDEIAPNYSDGDFHTFYHGEIVAAYRLR